MADSQNVVTTKFKVDISDLKKNIADANQQMKLANAQFKASASSMDDWASSADGLSAKIQQMTSVMDAQKSKLNAYKSQLGLVKSAYEENGRRAEELKTKMVQLIESGVDPASDEYKEYQRALQDVTKEQNANKKAADDLEITILNQQAAINNTERELHGYETALDSLDNAQDDAADSAEELDDSITEAGDAVQSASEGFTVMKGALADLVADGIRLAISALKDLANETFNVGAGFESAMSQVEAISGASGEEMDLLTDKAKEMGESTVFSATQSAEAFNYMAMAGWKTEDMLGGIEGIMDLAAASGEDLASTSDIVTDALTAMGYSAKDSGQLADVMAAASSNANANVKLMGQTFQYAAPIVGALGYNMEDTAVAIGLMANAGIKGEKSGTALRSILTRLSAPPKECAEEMEKLGISLTDSEGNMKSLDEVMHDLRGAFADLSETEQTSAAKHIAGQEAMSGLLSVVRAAPEDYDKLTKAVRNSSGAASKMAKTMTQNVNGQITLLRSKVEGIMIKVFENASDSIRKAIDTISNALDDVDWDQFADSAGKAGEQVAEFFSFVTKNGSSIVSVLKAIAMAFVTYKAVSTITSVVGAFQGLFTALKAGQGVVEVFNSVLGMNPYALVAAGVAALGLALWDFIKAQREATEAEYGLSSAQKESVEEAKKLADSYSQLDSARQESMQAISTEYGYINELKDEYNSLIDENGKVKEGYEDRAEFILTQLASALGVEREEIQQTIDANGRLGDSIDALIQKKQAEAILAANQDAYTTAIQKRDEALRVYQNSLTSLEEVEKKYQDSVAESGDVLGTYQALLKTSPATADDYYWANQRVIQGQQEAKEAYEEARQGLADSETAYIGYVNTISNYEGLSASIISGDADAIGQAMTAIQNSLITAENGTRTSLESQLATARQNYEDMKEAAATGLAGVTQETVSQAEQMVSMSEAELAKFNGAFTQKFGELQTLCEEQGIQIPDSLATGIQNGQYALPTSVDEMQSLVSFTELLKRSTDAGVDVPDIVSKGIKDGSMKPSQAVAIMNGLMEAKAKSASAPMNSAGKTAGSSYASGVNSNTGAAKQAGEALKANAKSGASGGYDAMKTEGGNAADGFKDGILSRVSSIASAAASFVRNAIDAAKREQDSHSPSKVWEDEVGEMSGEGYIIGLANKIRPAMNEARTLVKDSISAASKEISQNKIDFGNLGTNLRSGASFASGAMGAPSGRFGGVLQQGNVSGDTNITYNQTINSPKAPTRIELYRQTRNLLELAKGGT